MAASQAEPEPTPFDCIFQTVLGFLLPFFLAAANGDLGLAGAAVSELVDAYGAATVQELDLAGRVIGFSTAAMDNLRLSMSDPAMSDAKILRYRSNAIALSRMAEQCRAVLDALQAKRQQARVPPAARPAAPALAPEPEAAAAAPALPVPPPPAAARSLAPPPPAARSLALPPLAARPLAPPPSPAAGIGLGGADIEAMKLDARRMIEALRARGGPIAEAGPPPADPSFAHPSVPDPPLADPFGPAKAAAHAALANAG